MNNRSEIIEAEMVEAAVEAVNAYQVAIFDSLTPAEFKELQAAYVNVRARIESLSLDETLIGLALASAVEVVEKLNANYDKWFSPIALCLIECGVCYPRQACKDALAFILKVNGMCPEHFVECYSKTARDYSGIAKPNTLREKFCGTWFKRQEQEMGEQNEHNEG